MYLTLTSTAPAATDLGYLLHKHPARAQSFEQSAGTAHVFYPETSDERCTVALLLEVDPIALVRGKRFRAERSGAKRFGGDRSSLTQYVNDRPYAASSMLSVALGRVFGTALKGRCEARPELVGTDLPLEVRVPALPCQGGQEFVRRLFEPLGWTADAASAPLDPQIPDWGDSRYVDLRLAGTMTLVRALSHLYVLLPVLDDAKHYWVTQDEVDKLLRAGEGWLAQHPDHELITRRYLKHQRDLVTSATDRLAEVDDAVPEAMDAELVDPPTRPEPLAKQRRAAVIRALRASGAARIVDFGCGEGALLRELLGDPSYTEVLGVDVSPRALQLAERRFGLDRMPDSQRARIRLLQSSLTYRDERLAGFDAIVLMEVVEHLDPPRLPSLVRTVFAQARPRTVIVTTPNAEHNVRYEHLAAGCMRHPDHRFEWSRGELAQWAAATAGAHGYDVTYLPVGDDDPEVGPPTQLAVFTRTEKAEGAS